MSKKQTILALLQNDWTDNASMLDVTGWKPHTLRAFLATEPKKNGLKIERKRENGITSYRATNGAA